LFKAIGITTLFSLAACALGGCNGGGSIPSATSLYPGQIYAQTNAAAGNAIIHYGRGSDGRLTMLSTTSTGGVGIGGTNVANGNQSVDPLFSNYSVVITPDHAHLFSVNAGSNTVSSFTLAPDGTPHLVGTYATGGIEPTSIAVYGNLVYIGHAKPNTSNVQLTGFHLQSDGSLTAISGAQYQPSAATIVSSVAFSPSGSLLELTELMTGKIALYPVQSNGTLGTPVRNTSAAAGPFGATFVDSTHLLIANAGAGSVSSYNVAANGTITPISSSVVNGQKATCWVRVTPNGQIALAANTTSSNVSVYALDASGTLTLLNASQDYQAPQGTTDFSGNAASGPVDGVVSSDSRYYYQEFSGLGIISANTIHSDGTLTPIANGDGTGLPALGAEGIAGY